MAKFEQFLLMYIALVVFPLTAIILWSDAGQANHIRLSMGFVRFSEHMFHVSKEENEKHYRTPEDANQVLLCPLKTPTTLELESNRDTKDTQQGGNSE